VKISKTMATGLMVAMVAAAVNVRAFADLFDQQPSPKPAVNRVAEGPCEPLTWEAANHLPSWVRASDVTCMSVSVEDMQNSRKAQELLVQAAGQAHEQGSFSTPSGESQYIEGVEAYAEGKYTEAIAHFRAAMPSISPVEYKH
jgi:hypothetical protein